MPRILLRVLFAIGGAAGLYVVFFPLTYGVTTRIVGSFVTDDFVPPVILAPERPLDGDDTMKRVLEIADAVVWDEDDPCARDAEGRDEVACRALAKSNGEVIERLATWATDPGPLGPRQREAHGRHARAPVAVGINYELPPLTPQLRLADLLALATEYAFADGDRTTAERALRLMFDLGAYFEHNPSSLIHEMVGVALTNEAVVTAARLVPAESAATVESWLPADADRLLSLQLSLGAEWLNLGYFLDHELQNGPGPFAAEDGVGQPSATTWELVETAGLYDPVHTRQMHDVFWGEIQAKTRQPPLKTNEVEIETWEEMGTAKYFHNPIGRMLFTIAAPGFVRYGARVGSSIDRVTALRVVLAARTFHAEHGRWPESPDDFDFAWPKSALTGSPLFWDRQANVIRLFDEVEDGFCTDEDAGCELAFAL